MIIYTYLKSYNLHILDNNVKTSAQEEESKGEVREKKRRREISTDSSESSDTEGSSSSEDETVQKAESSRESFQHDDSKTSEKVVLFTSCSFIFSSIYSLP